MNVKEYRAQFGRVEDKTRKVRKQEREQRKQREAQVERKRGQQRMSQALRDAGLAA